MQKVKARGAIRQNMKIPKIIQEAAEGEGCNSVTFAGEVDGYLVFGCGNVGDDGIPIPEGLPTFILLKNGKTKVIYGEDGLKLIDRLQ